MEREREGKRRKGERERKGREGLAYSNHLGPRKTYGQLWLQRLYLAPFLKYCHCDREKSFTFDSKSSSKYFGNSHVATPHGRKLTRPLCVLPDTLIAMNYMYSQQAYILENELHW